MDKHSDFLRALFDKLIPISDERSDAADIEEALDNLSFFLISSNHKRDTLIECREHFRNVANKRTDLTPPKDGPLLFSA